MHGEDSLHPTRRKKVCNGWRERQSEIKPLKKVLLHRPGKELLNLTPNTLEELLFDDIPFLKVARRSMTASHRPCATTALRLCTWRT